MIRHRRRVLLPVLLAMMGCGPAETPPDSAPSAVRPRAEPRPAPHGAAGPVDADALVAGNDRAIAENKRMDALRAAFDRQDPERLARLESACARAGGPAVDRDGELRIIRCIAARWR